MALSEQHIETMRQIKPLYLGYKKNQTLDVPPMLYKGLQDAHMASRGVGIQPCGSCLVKAIQSLLIESGVGTE